MTDMQIVLTQIALQLLIVGVYIIYTRREARNEFRSYSGTKDFLWYFGCIVSIGIVLLGSIIAQGAN